MRSAHLRPKALERGFTLVELLVVISIIAMLIALLLPALAGARNSGRNAVCKSQERQIALSITTYAQDYKGWAPLVETPGAGYGEFAWMFLISDYINGPPKSDMMAIYATPQNGANWVKSPTQKIKVLQCPSTYRAFEMWGYNSYGINYNITLEKSIFTTLQWPVSLDSPKVRNRTSEFPLLAESVSYNMILPMWNAVRLYDHLHLQRRNYAFADGHVADTGKQQGNFLMGHFQNGTLLFGRNNHAGSDPALPGYND
jgi:prepilin-type N-terminal cleavage/methylation domain-containing protein/prepilin-type processing-associated H-X9-DG protein